MAISARCPKVPKFLLLIFYILSLIRRFISCLLRILGLGAFTDSEDHIIPPTTHLLTISESHSDSVAAAAASSDLIKKFLPVVKFENLQQVDNITDSCAVCLCEFEGEDEIRPLMDCRHIFHRSCLDRWMDHDQRTCPLCRTPFVPIEMHKAFKASLLHLSVDDINNSESS
ncbi:zinc finger protein [Macleaya cordata]|uniref:Zinc finger protein n=1 Tax=Macleaya cordata TaxID=56857 RepID=A0A200PYN7_MACCD|nr:zinc finger protein [Macleaya cordata]